MVNEDHLSLLRLDGDEWNQWRKAHMDVEVDFTGVDFCDNGCYLIRRNLSQIKFNGAKLQGKPLLGSDLRGASFGEAYFLKTDLRGADLRYVIFDMDTDLSGAWIDETTNLGDVKWNGVDLTVVDWEPIYKIGEEIEKHPHDITLRAYRQIAGQLRSQGMNEYADRFSYRAQVVRKHYLWKKRKFGAALWSSFIDILAGFGYQPQRSFFFYLLTNIVFGSIYYFIILHEKAVLSPLSAFVFSVASFHGRGFFPNNITIDDPLTVVAAIEAFVGLIVEASFIATFTDRYFGK